MEETTQGNNSIDPAFGLDASFLVPPSESR